MKKQLSKNARCTPSRAQNNQNAQNRAANYCSVSSLAKLSRSLIRRHRKSASKTISVLPGDINVDIGVCVISPGSVLSTTKFVLWTHGNRMQKE